jgi:hypothetical protein
MQYYKATIRLDGSTMNEVVKILSAPEVLILQYIHGSDALVKMAKSKNEKVNLNEEKERLRVLYDQALNRRKQSIDSIFGPLGQVPEVLSDSILEQNDIIDEDDIIAVAKSVTKHSKSDKTMREPRTQEEADRLSTVITADEVSLEEMAG